MIKTKKVQNINKNYTIGQGECYNEDFFAGTVFSDTQIR